MAQVDYFLKIDGIPGDSVDQGHKGEINVEAFSWGESLANRGAATGGAGAGKVSMQDFHFTAVTNSSSPKLMLACASGKHFPTATLTCRKAGGDRGIEFLKIKLSDILVSEYKLGGDQLAQPTEIIPTDQFSLNFTRVEFNFSLGSVIGGDSISTFDLTTNSGQ